MKPLTCFDLNIQDHIAHLVLNRPQVLNTLDLVFWRELDDVLQALHQGNQARVLVISSTGKHFSAGMALDTFAGAIQMYEKMAEVDPTESLSYFNMAVAYGRQNKINDAITAIDKALALNPTENLRTYRQALQKTLAAAE